MSERRDYYDENGRHIGYSYPNSRTHDSSFTLGFILIGMGLIAAIIGIIFGIGPMMGYIVFCLVCCGIGVLLGFLCIGITKLNDLLDDWTNGHASLIWISLMVFLLILSVSACHNWLMGL